MYQDPRIDPGSSAQSLWSQTWLNLGGSFVLTSYIRAVLTINSVFPVVQFFDQQMCTL